MEEHMFLKFGKLSLLLSVLITSAYTQTSSLSGTYKTLLLHEDQNSVAKYHQFADITLRTVNTGDGNIKISASARIYYGDASSNEFLTYDFPDVPLNILTRQISLKTEESDVSLIGFIKDNKISGEWFSTTLGKVGSFSSTKLDFPVAPTNSELVKPISALYKGKITNTNANSNLPERITLTLITTQGLSGNEITLKISGNLRFYLGDFGSLEYVETPLEDVKLNFYNRYITIRTKEYGVTLKGVLNIDGSLDADVFADGFGLVGTVKMEIK